MKKLSIIYGLTLGLMMVALASCSTSKGLRKEASIGNVSASEYMNELITSAPAWDAVTAKMTVELARLRKQPTKVSGTLRMKRGEVIQISVAPLLGIELARMEISPEGVLLMDRVNKRYVQVPFSQLKEMTHADLDFHVLQALFLNELFLPGKDSLTAADARRFAVRAEAEQAVIDVERTRQFSYRFRTGITDRLLRECRIELQGSEYALNWQYDDFRELEQRPFPRSMVVTLEGGKDPIETTFRLSRLSTNSDWDTHTEVPAKYEKVEVKDILKMLDKQ